jgi:hypothetical protein
MERGEGPAGYRPGGYLTKQAAGSLPLFFTNRRVMLSKASSVGLGDKLRWVFVRDVRKLSMTGL